ncbi:MAG: DUF3617 family protein [Candidatus Acidiferrales bacterium]
MKRRTLYAATAFLLPATIALAGGPPALKEGFWSLNRQTVDNPGNKKEVWAPIKICRDHAYDQYVLELAKKVPGCTTVSESMHGNAYLADLKCVIGNTTLDTKSTTTVQGDTASHGESHTLYTPAMEGKTETIMISDAKYLGSCPAGMQPGDRMNADGTIVHGEKH